MKWDEDLPSWLPELTIEAPDGRYLSLYTWEGIGEFALQEAHGRLFPLDVFGDLYALHREQWSIANGTYVDPRTVA